jgi:hypothetical protein
MNLSRNPRLAPGNGRYRACDDLNACSAWKNQGHGRARRSYMTEPVMGLPSTRLSGSRFDAIAFIKAHG